MSATPSTKLSRPIVGVVVLGVVVVILGLILAAAYHGSSTSNTAQCAGARGILGRISRDVQAVAGGHAAAAQITALQKDDDELNNFLNAGHPALDARLLPVAENLGRTVTDLRDAAPAQTDLAALESALGAATTFCGAS